MLLRAPPTKAFYIQQMHKIWVLRADCLGSCDCMRGYVCVLQIRDQIFSSVQRTQRNFSIRFGFIFFCEVHRKPSMLCILLTCSKYATYDLLLYSCGWKQLFLLQIKATPIVDYKSTFHYTSYLCSYLFLSFSSVFCLIKYSSMTWSSSSFVLDGEREISSIIVPTTFCRTQAELYSYA